jgi:hypothetical protein
MVAKTFDGRVRRSPRALAGRDVQKLQVEYLIDDSAEHREAARKHGLADRYIVAPAFGSQEDSKDPMLWRRLIENVLWPPR